MNNNSPIGVFDSGLGGLTVLKELKEILPNENFIFVGDSANAPYGSKTPDELKILFDQFMNYFSLRKVKLAVCACNTMTSYLKNLKMDLPFPIIWMDSSVDKALALSLDNEIAVIATKGTVSSQMHQIAARKLNPSAVVHSIACPQFVPLIETANLESTDLIVSIEEYLSKIPWNKVQSIILGCTHYPIILEKLKEFAPVNTHFVNPAKSTSQLTRKYLELNNNLNNQIEDGNIEFYFSAFTPSSKKLMRIILPKHKIKVHLINLNEFRK